MSISSDEEFFDAQDTIISSRCCSFEQNVEKSFEFPVPRIPIDDKFSAHRTLPTNENAREKKSLKKFRELRQCMQTEEEEGTSNISPISSQVSSIDEVFADSSKMQHPFRIIEHDTLSVHSMTSLGRVGRILSSGGGCDAGAESSNPEPEERTGSTDTLVNRDLTSGLQLFIPLQEPDVIASTKGSRSCNHVSPVETESAPPVAPPRRKRKAKKHLQDMDVYNTESTIENLTRELKHSLDATLAIKETSPLREFPNERPSKSSNGRKPVSRVVSCGSRASYPLNHMGGNKARNSGTYPLSAVSSHTIAGTRGGLGLRLGLHGGKSRERRKSLGDEQEIPPELNLFARTRTNSGKQLTDIEILERVTVLNLDTGEQVPLSIAEDKIPKCINPLSLHIMRLTSEYGLEKREKESDEESVSSKLSYATTQDGDVDAARVTKKEKFKKFLGSTVKKTVNKAKTIAQEVSQVRHKEDVVDIIDEVHQSDAFKLRTSNSHKGPYDFQSIRHVQELGGEHVGPIWCMKFSSCGRLLATAGQDRVLRIWVIKSAFAYFQDMRTKYDTKISPTPSQESVMSQQSDEPCDILEVDNGPFVSKPFCVYRGHTSDLLDISWSKNYFVLSSSMDKTVRLWHISRKECLCCFQHIEFVTAICFHPKDDRYFLSGSLDGKLRLWNIPDKKVSVWSELDGASKLITAANFCQSGKMAVVGSYDGRCVIYATDQLRYHTTIHVRSTRGKYSKGRKITGIEPMPGGFGDKILVTSNDSRIRLYDMNELSVSCKYKGYANISSQIKASFSHDGKYIVSGSENQCIYIWKTHHDYSKFPTSSRRDRNDFWEAIKGYDAVVTCAIFAPNPGALLQEQQSPEESPCREESAAQTTQDLMLAQHSQPNGYVLVSADFKGCIRIFFNKTKPKHSSLPASALV